MTTLVLRRVHLPVYLNQNPPDMANVTLNWNKVVEIDPISSIAKTVTTHPGALAPSASPVAAAFPASGTPAPASPAGNGN